MKFAKGDQARLTKLVEANVVATHAYQVLLARKAKPGRGGQFASDLTDAQLNGLIAHQTSLLSAGSADVADWVAGKMSRFDEDTDITPLLAAAPPPGATLPVNVITGVLRKETGKTRLECRALASLFQMMLDINRDGDRLQEMFALYVAVGLPVHLGQVGIENTDAEFVRLGKALAADIGPAPFETDRRTLRMLCVKMTHWGRRHTGERTASTVADELLAEPDVAALIPRIKASPARRIAVIGHSFTMGVHWARPSSFVPITTEIIGRYNDRVKIRQWAQGGLTAAGAKKRFYAPALAWKPDAVLLVVVTRSAADGEALAAMGKGFAAAGVEVLMFDGLAVGGSFVDGDEKIRDAAVAGSGITLIEVGRMLKAAPDTDTFLCLDGVHMTEPYHRLMTKQWLGYLTGAREATLPAPERKK